MKIEITDLKKDIKKKKEILSSVDKVLKSGKLVLSTLIQNLKN